MLNPKCLARYEKPKPYPINYGPQQLRDDMPYPSELYWQQPPLVYDSDDLPF